MSERDEAFTEKLLTQGLNAQNSRVIDPDLAGSVLSHLEKLLTNHLPHLRLALADIDFLLRTQDIDPANPRALSQSEKDQLITDINTVLKHHPEI